MLPVIVIDLLLRMFKVLTRLPGVVLSRVSLPFDQVLQFSSAHTRIDDLFDNILFFSFDFYG